jgi:hypothetical protein
MQAILNEIRSLGHEPLGAPRPEVSEIGALSSQWEADSLQQIETRKITVRRTFADFDDYWTTGTLTGSVGATVAKLTPAEVATVKERLRAKVPMDSSGRITCSAFANAVKGRVPK